MCRFLYIDQILIQPWKERKEGGKEGWREGSRRTPLRSNPLLWDQTHSDRPILISSQRWPWPSYHPITHFSETHHLSVPFHWGPRLQHMKPGGTNHSRWRLIGSSDSSKGIHTTLYSGVCVLVEWSLPVFLFSPGLFLLSASSTRSPHECT